MNKILIPVVGVAVVYSIAQGWLTSVWQSLYAMAHQGGSGNPGTGIQSPGSVISGIPTSGSDIPTDPSGNALPQLPGTFNPGTHAFTPNNPSVPQFQCSLTNNLGCVIPSDYWPTLQQLLRSLGL